MMLFFASDTSALAPGYFTVILDFWYFVLFLACLLLRCFTLFREVALVFLKFLSRAGVLLLGVVLLMNIISLFEKHHLYAIAAGAIIVTSILVGIVTATWRHFRPSLDEPQVPDRGNTPEDW
jgi:hypothetical protein